MSEKTTPSISVIEPSRWRLEFIALLTIGLCLVILPFIGIQSIGISDYANHMSRFYIADNIEQSSVLSDFYEFKPSDNKYWGMDVFVKALTPAFGAETASYIFTIIAFYLPFVGVVTLNRVVTKRVNWITLIAIIFVFNETAGWGFTNFLFSFGVSLLIFSAWITTERWHWALRLPIFLSLFSITSGLHLIVAALLGLSIFTWQSVRFYMKEMSLKEWIHVTALVTICFLPSLFLVLSEFVNGSNGSGLRWVGLAYHLSTVLSPIIFINGSAGFILHFIPIILLRWGLVSVSKSPYFHFDKPLLSVAITIFLLGIVTPYAISGVAYVGMRLPIIAAFILVAAIRPVKTESLSRLSLTLIATAIFIKLGLVHVQISHLDNRITEMRTASKALPLGTKIFPVVTSNTPENQMDPRTIPNRRYSNFAGFIVSDREALFPYFFSMFDVGITDQYKRITIPQGYAVKYKNLYNPEELPYFASSWESDFDYMLLMHFGNAEALEPFSEHVISSGSWFAFIEIETDK